MRASDRNFILKSWVRSVRGHFPYSKMSPGAVRKYSRRIESLIDSTAVVVSCDPDNVDTLFGFACGECGRYIGIDSPTLHYVFVRNDLRRHGIGTQLVRTIFPGKDRLIYTHITREIHRANLETKWNLREFDPYYIEGAIYPKARSLDLSAAVGI